VGKKNQNKHMKKTKMTKKEKKRLNHLKLVESKRGHTSQVPEEITGSKKAA